MDSELIRLFLGILTGILGVCALFPYLRDIVHGTTRPNIVSWGGWTFLTGIAATAQFTEGATLSVLVPLSSTIGMGIITLFAFRFGYTKFTRLDGACLLLGITAICLWVYTAEPILAIILAIVADLILGIPTLLKAYRDPESETISTWFIFTASAFLGILASQNTELHNMLYPVYILVFDGTVGLLVLRGKMRKNSA